MQVSEGPHPTIWRRARRFRFLERKDRSVILGSTTGLAGMAKRAARRFGCPCCGYQTLTQAPPGTFEICPVCDWEDDNLQFAKPDYEGGANKISLRQAQNRFLRLHGLRQLARISGFKRDPDWEPLSAEGSRRQQG